ncbi:MAG: phosphonoacetaldehyde hydrolase [Chitinispirillia bacterium]|nr:phosphonoacetaldehyde hydrolase [Chitinispirillia bacterium]MCL2269069.1 phosphonoacetaldehyde hydrolase [Chitinispirillia bacterium]
MSRRISTIILDWAGTTVDYGCFAPVNAFISAFNDFGIRAGIEETRAPMGMAKRAHIEKMLESPGIAGQWRAKYGRSHTDNDVADIYERFEPALFKVLTQHASPIPGAVDAVAKIRSMGIGIGSTTGYTKAMMDVVAPAAKKNGYAPDCLVCPEDAGGKGRPYPFMLWRNLEILGVMSVRSVLKVGDTVADMEEGKNAGCLTVGVLKGSSLQGLSEDETAGMSGTELSQLMEMTRSRYMDAGADCVIGEISALPALIESMNS